jgi:hypothetical protein
MASTYLTHRCSGWTEDLHSHRAGRLRWLER